MPDPSPRPSRCLGAILALILVAPAWGQPGTATVATSVAVDADAAHPAGTIRAALEFRFAGGFHVQSSKPLDPFLVPTALTITPPPGFTVREIVYPQPVKMRVEGFTDPLDVFEETFVVGVALDVGAGVPPGLHTVAGALEYQACNDKVCLAPTSVAIKIDVKVVAPGTPVTPGDSPLFRRLTFSESPAPAPAPAPAPVPAPRVAPAAQEGCDIMKELSGFTVLGTAGGYLGADDFIAFVDGAESGSIKKNVLEGKGPVAIVLLVLVGGVLLNLTPCVLPLIPINLAIIGAGTQAGSRGRGFALGGTYGLAMAAVYGVLGLVVILTAASFGAINSTIWFNVAIAILFVVLALAMFDIINIDFSRYQGRIDTANMARRGTFALAFVMGAVSALLAGACIAPVVIQVVVYASDQYARGTKLALALPFFLGLGMALPWPFAGAGLSCLPRPGMWMVRVKQAMGVFILAFAAYYGYLAWEIWNSRRVDRDEVEGAVAESLAEGWTASLCEGLARARAEDKPVLVDMWATWCKNCLAMDKTTFKDPGVRARLEGFVKVKYQAEDLGNPPASEVLARFEGIGLPTYAILRPERAE